MIAFILNENEVTTDLPAGITVLDFIRYRKNLKGTKIGCREGDCGACTILVGELIEGEVRYRTMTSCLMPLANAAGKHIVTIEGINPTDGSLTPVQQAMVDESGTQCGFCTAGFVMSLTGFCIENGIPRVSSPHVSKGSSHDLDAAISAIDGNICRCTGYKSIERAARLLSEPPASADGQLVPDYFKTIGTRLKTLTSDPQVTDRPLTKAVPTGGGTDLYVQRPEAMAESGPIALFYDDKLRGIRDVGDTIEIGASATVTDLLESPVMNAVFPDLYKHLKLVSSTPIRNMATLAGNFVNASPIGDMTVFFLALDSEIKLSEPPASAGGQFRAMKLRDLYLGYKQLAKEPDELITSIRFKKPTDEHFFNFEKVCKRTYLDIATVNTAILLKLEAMPGKGWIPPALSEPEAVATGLLPTASSGGQFAAADGDKSRIEYNILEAHVSAGGVAPVPLYLKETSAFLIGQTINDETVDKANAIMQHEISPISDVRGTEEYKRLLLRQLFRAHFVELFGSETL